MSAKYGDFMKIARTIQAAIQALLLGLLQLGGGRPASACVNYGGYSVRSVRRRWAKGRGFTRSATSLRPPRASEWISIFAPQRSHSTIIASRGTGDEMKGINRQGQH